MKSLIATEHAEAINKVFSISAVELRNARRIVQSFEQARKEGKDRAKVDGKLIEVPIYSAAKRLLSSASHTQPQPRKKIALSAVSASASDCDRPWSLQARAPRPR